MATRKLIPVRQAVTDLLRDIGVKRIFGNPGSTELGMFRDFPKDFKYVLGLQESVVVAMADGYAQATHQAAFINLHSAAGVGHAMGSIFTAWKNQTPLVITAGQQSRALLPFDPFLSSSEPTLLPRPYVKWAVQPARGENVPQVIARAYYTAMQAPRGPVLVSIPAEDWECLCEPIPLRRVAESASPDPALLEEIGSKLDAAKRPVLVLGPGVDREQAWDDAIALAERYRAPVWMTPHAGRNGFPQDHRLFAGFLPASRTAVVERLQGSDFVFVVGGPAFYYHVPGEGPHVPVGAELAQLTDNPTQAAWTPVGMAVVGSPLLGIRALLARETTPRKRSWPVARKPAPRLKPSTPMDAAYVFQTLAELRAPDSIIVEEVTSARRKLHEGYLPILRPETFYTMNSGGLGFSLPASVGIALGRPGVKVIAMLGDGSSMYSIQGLWTAVQERLPVAFLIFNNQRYAVLKEFAPVYGISARQAKTLAGTDLPGIDFVGLAKAMGCPAERAETPEALDKGLRKALRKKDGPILVEIRIA